MTLLMWQWASSLSRFARRWRTIGFSSPGTPTSGARNAESRLGNCVAGLEEAELVRERPRSKPNPSVVVRQIDEDGNEVEVIWSWLGETRQAKLVTVYLVE